MKTKATKTATRRIGAVAKTLLPGQRTGERKIREQIRAGHNPAIGFLHIPKTGGSGVRALSRAVIEAGQPFPCYFGHAWTVAEIRERFPDMKLALILRDPLERMISGFNSRLRQGRPAHSDNLWRPAEATVFAMFPEVSRYLDALIADDEWSRSAVAFAQKHVTHLRWNYRHYFPNRKAVRENAGQIALVGRLEATDAFLEALLAAGGAAPDKVAGLYARAHEAPVRSASVLERYSPDQVARMRDALAGEYAIHDALAALADERAAGGPATGAASGAA
jgi:hypothetical protein